MQAKTVYLAQGETRKVSNEWGAECDARNATISSSAWSGTATLGAVTLTGTLATALITGSGSLVNTVVLSNGETLVNERLIKAA